jgi:hypothetical protein
MARQILKHDPISPGFWFRAARPETLECHLEDFPLSPKIVGYSPR